MSETLMNFTIICSIVIILYEVYSLMNSGFNYLYDPKKKVEKDYFYRMNSINYLAFFGLSLLQLLAFMVFTGEPDNILYLKIWNLEVIFIYINWLYFIVITVFFVFGHIQLRQENSLGK